MNKISKLLVFTIVLLIMGTFVFGQSLTGSDGPNPADIGVDTAQQMLKEVSISKFEDAGFWTVSMGRDQGITTLRRLPGGSIDKEAIPDEEQIGFITSKVLEYING